MSSTQQDVVIKSVISPVLFMNTDGEAMCFYLRPGPVKRSLQPLITAGGGLLCNAQQPRAILLIDDEEAESVPASSAHWYVSTKYIYDCIENEEQLNFEQYRLNPEVCTRNTARLNNKVSSPGHLRGRVAYSPEDDAAIMSYVSQGKTKVMGNQLWQEMEKQQVTSHSWQSMKHRYKSKLAKTQSEPEEAKRAEKEEKDEENEETCQEPCCEEDTQVEPSAENDLTQIMDQPISPETQTENVDAQTLNSSHGEVQHPKNDVQPAEVVTIDAGTAGVPRPASSESAEAQSAVSPQKETSLQPLPDSPSKKRKTKQVSPKPPELQRRVTRRQHELEASSPSEAYGRKLRSSLNSVEKSSSTVETPKKTKSPVKSARKEDAKAGHPLSKRARGESVTAAVESHQEELEEATVFETPQPVEESSILPHEGEKKKEKRQLGILELATKEFEDESESGEDEAPDAKGPAETVAIQPTSTQPCFPSSDTAADASPPRSDSESGHGLQSNVHGVQVASNDPVPETGCTKPEATVNVASRAHLFIFGNDSQEDDSQSLVGDNTAAAAQAVGNGNAAPSLTQVQLEEDMQQIKALMEQTNRDLVSVTKALLKTSGDVAAALNLLSYPSMYSGPFWNRNDDSLLLSADPNAWQQLREKYGEENLARRVAFLEVER